MTIVVTGVTSMANRGVEALVVPIVANLKILFPREKIYVLTKNPQHDTLLGPLYGCTFVPDACLRRRRLKKHPWADTAIRMIYQGTKDWRRVKNLIGRAKLVVATGGDVFSSEYNNQDGHLESLRIAVKKRAPVVFLAHSIGPYLEPREARDWMGVARAAAAITLREELSYRYVKDSLGLQGPQIELTADPAFLLEAESSSETKKSVLQASLAKNSPIIGIAPSRGIAFFKGFGPEGHQKHLEVWVEVILYILDTIGANVLLVPHVQVTGNNDDQEFCHSILRCLNDDERVSVAPGGLRASEYKGVLSSCALVIAERMHAGIAALSRTIPTLLVGYSVKAEGVLRQVLDNGDAVSHSLVSFDDFLNLQVAIEAVRNSWEERRNTRELLEKMIPMVCIRARENFEKIKQIANKT